MTRCDLGHELDPVATWLRYLDNVGVNTLNTSRYRHLSPAVLGRTVMIRGKELLERALAKERGVLLLTAHQHCLILFNACIGLLGHPVDVILRDPAATTPDFLTGHMDQTLADSARHFNGGQYLQVDYRHRSIRSLLRALEQGHILISANDLPGHLAGKRRMTVPFLGHSLSLVTGSVELALQRHVPILAGFIRWEKNNRFTIDLQEVPVQDLAGVMACYGHLLEQAVQKDPGGWEGWNWQGLQVS